DRVRPRTRQRRLRGQQVEQAAGARAVAAQRHLLRLGGAREQISAGAHLLRGGAQRVEGIEHLVDHLLLEAVGAPRGRVGGGRRSVVWSARRVCDSAVRAWSTSAMVASPTLWRCSAASRLLWASLSVVCWAPSSDLVPR